MGGMAEPFDARARRFLAAHRVARLATVDPDGTPSVVPICYALDAAAIYSPLDAKPKRVPPRALRRVRNLLARPAVALVVDDYAEDWSCLAHLIVRGQADLLEPGEPEHALAVAQLRARYPQYHRMAIEAQPVIRIVPTRWRFWAVVPEAVDPGPVTAPRLDVFALLAACPTRPPAAFLADPVPPAVLSRLLRAIPLPASPVGVRLAVVTEPSERARLVAALAAIAPATSATPEGRLLGAAPVLLLLGVDPAGDRDDSPVVDDALLGELLGHLTASIGLAAFAAGLAAARVTLPHAAAVPLTRALDLDAALRPVALIALGYATGPGTEPAPPSLADRLVRWL